MITTEPRKLTILVDLDAIVIDLIRPWLNWYNNIYNDSVTIDDIKTYEIEKHTKKTEKIYDIYKFFEEHQNYADCPVLPGAAEGLLELREAGHDIIIATASDGQTAHLKWPLARKAAPWLHESDIMVGSRKEKLFGDVLIDDAPKNIVKYRNAWPNAHVLTIAYPYNLNCRTIVNCYASDHNNTDKAWEEMCNYIHALARR